MIDIGGVNRIEPLGSFGSRAGDAPFGKDSRLEVGIARKVAVNDRGEASIEEARLHLKASNNALSEGIRVRLDYEAAVKLRDYINVAINHLTGAPQTKEEIR